MLTLKDFFKEKFGMIYTSPTKGNVDHKFFTIDEASFLKRRFGKMVHQGKTYITAQLDLDSIHNSIMWQWKEKSVEKQWDNLCMMCNSYLMEYFKYGEKKFEYARRQILGRMTLFSKRLKMKQYYYPDFRDHFKTWALEHVD